MNTRASASWALLLVAVTVVPKVFGQEVEAVELDRRVRALVDSLSASEDAARETAQRELYRLGPVILQVLDELPAPPDEDARQRLGQIRKNIWDQWNPFSVARPGDWLEHRFVIVENGRKQIETIRRTTFKSHTNNGALLSVLVTVNGRVLPPREETVPLDKPWRRSFIPPSRPDQEIVDFGKETITVGGREYRCRWIRKRLVMSTTTDTLTLWYSPDLPLDGLVRMEGESTGRKNQVITVDLVGYGRAEDAGRRVSGR